MPPGQNRQVILKSRPTGIPQAEHFEIVSTPLPELQPGELLVRNDFLSVDPAMRGWVNAAANYSDPVAVGAVMRSFAAGQVIASRNPAYAENDRVMGMLGWQEYAVTDGKSIRRTWKCKDFLAAIHFYDKVAELAEKEQHHPDLHLTGYRMAAIEMTTHAIGGLSENDFIMAAKIDQVPVEAKK